jgi:hypothetical protein
MQVYIGFTFVRILTIGGLFAFNKWQIINLLISSVIVSFTVEPCPCGSVSMVATVLRAARSYLTGLSKLHGPAGVQRPVGKGVSLECRIQDIVP